MVRKSSIAVAAVIAVSLVGTAAGATLRSVDLAPLAPVAQGGPIEISDAPGALDRPEVWSCDRIYPDYRRWLDEGNPAESWKYADRTYRDSATGQVYDWQDWLDWADSAGCAAAAPAESGVNMAVAGTIAALGVGALVAASGSGSGSKSPG